MTLPTEAELALKEAGEMLAQALDDRDPTGGYSLPLIQALSVYAQGRNQLELLRLSQEGLELQRAADARNTAFQAKQAAMAQVDKITALIEELADLDLGKFDPPTEQMQKLVARAQELLA